MNLCRALGTANNKAEGALNKITGNLQISECRQRFKEAIILRFPDRPSYDINFTAVLYEIE